MFFDQYILVFPALLQNAPVPFPIQCVPVGCVYEQRELNRYQNSRMLVLMLVHFAMFQENLPSDLLLLGDFWVVMIPDVLSHRLIILQEAV